MHTTDTIIQACRTVGINSVATDLLIKALEGKPEVILPETKTIERGGLELKQVLDSTYYISPCGQVYNSKRSAFIKPGLKGKYLVFTMSQGTYINGQCPKNRKQKIHRLVAGAFVPNPENKPFVNHIDGNTSNNHYTNLEWVTSFENTSHHLALVRRKYNKRTLSSMLTETQIKEVFSLRDMGVSIKEIARIYGLNQGSLEGFITKELNRATSNV